MTKKERQPSAIEQRLNNFVVTHLTRIPLVQKIFFVEHLHTMIHAGLSLVESLGVLSKEIENEKLKNIIGEIKTDVEKGQPLSEVLAKHPKAFPPIYVKMINAGEISGKLETSLKQIVKQMKKTHELNSSIRGAMIYPAVIVVAMSAIGVMMVTFVLPKLMVLFEEFEAELPLATRVLIAISNFMSQPLNVVLVITITILAIAGFVYSIKKYPGFKRLIHRINLHLFIIGPVIKKINLARFSLTLSSLLKSAIPIVEAVDITAETCGNMLYKEHLHQSTEKIKTGTPLSEILGEKIQLFPPMVTEMIMVGERTGEVDQLLDELSGFYRNEVEKTMKNFTTVIEPIIILVLGLAVAGMAVAVIMPMYTLVQNF